ncbi:MAG: NAD-binding protein [Pirellulaceae bacterium]
MSGPFRRMITGVVFFFLVCGAAMGGYLLAGWSVDDAFYMVIITIFGVGYGEVKPIESPALRMLTMSTIIAGYAAVIYTVGGFVQMLIDGEINRALGARRMTRGIDRMQDHTIVCGYGRIGSTLASHLARAKKPFVVVEADAEKIKEAESHGFLVLNGNATEDAILEQAGIARARVLAAVVSDDAANVFITITARDLNPHLEIIARGENPSTERKLLRSGATQVVSPTTIGAARMAHLITHPSAESLLAETATQQDLNEQLSQIGLHFDELHISPGSPLAGHKIGDIEVRGNLGFLVVALRRGDGRIELNPGADAHLSSGDTVIVLGHDADIPQLVQRYVSKNEITYRGARINALPK